MSFVKIPRQISHNENQQILKVFFDNSCSICRREVAHYQFLDGDYMIQWIDISDSHCDLSHYGISRLSAMRVFHVMDTNGNIHTGENAFIVLWSVLPGYRIIAKLFQFKPFKSMLAYLYRLFSRWRFKKQCKTGVCL